LKDRLRDSERTTFIAVGIAVVVIWFIIGSVINKTAIARTEEIALMKLLGMSRHYLFAPFVIHGLFLGSFGALCGLGCFYGMFYIFKSQLGAVDFLTIYQSILIVVGEMIVGLLAGFVAQRKFA
jgi:cell division transport system permease protein